MSSGELVNELRLFLTLARGIGVPLRSINEIVHGTRRLTADTARRLAAGLGLAVRYTRIFACTSAGGSSLITAPELA